MNRRRMLKVKSPSNNAQMVKFQDEDEEITHISPLDLIRLNKLLIDTVQFDITDSTAIKREAFAEQGSEKIQHEMIAKQSPEQMQLEMGAKKIKKSKRKVEVHYLFDQSEHPEQFDQNSPEQTGDPWWILKSTGESSSQLEL